MSEEDQKEYLKAFEKYVDKKPFDVPVKMTKHDQAKPLKGFGGASVLEVVEDHMGDTYRAVYTVKIAERVYVLHCFQKKSTKGIETPKQDMDLIHERLKAAQAHAKGA